MEIAILSDTRMPTSLSYAGHGLGRSLARIATGLAERGHDVTLFGLRDTFAWGCHTVYGEDEKDWAMLCMPDKFDAIIDGTHQFDYAHTYQHYSHIVCKVADGECPSGPPKNAVWGNDLLPIFFGLKYSGLCIPEGIDVDNIPLKNTYRHPDLCFASAMHRWKKPEVAVEVAEKVGWPIWMVGEPQREFAYSRVFYRPSLSGTSFYSWLGRMRGMIYPVPSMAELEAAACGTPSIVMMADDSWHEHGVTGFTAVTVDEAVEAVKHLNELDKYRMREWVADNRSISGMCAQWEKVLEKAANGEAW